MSAIKRVFAISTPRYASDMMILQIRPMMLELVRRANVRRDVNEHQFGCTFLRQAFCILGSKHMARRRDTSCHCRRRHFKTVGDAPRLVDEQRGGCGRTDLARSL